MLFVSGITAMARFVRDSFQEAGFFVTLTAAVAKTAAEADKILARGKANYVILSQVDSTCAVTYRVVCLHNGVLETFLRGYSLTYDGVKKIGKTPAGYTISEFTVEFTAGGYVI